MEISTEQLAKFAATLICRTKHQLGIPALTNESLIKTKKWLVEDINNNFPDGSVIDKMWDELLEV